MAHMLTAAGALRLPPLQQPPRSRPFMRLVCHEQPNWQPREPAGDTSAADFRKMFDVNALTCFLCCREAVRRMRLTGKSDAGGGAGGRIVNVAARPAVVPAGGMIAYGTAKAAVASITQSLAEEVKG